MVNFNGTLFLQVVACIPLLLVALGIILNGLCLFLFTSDKDLKKMSSMVYLSYIVVMDTFSLFDWNIDHFVLVFFNYNPEYSTIFLCRFMSFYQYTSLMASAILISMMDFDRYISIVATPGSFYSRLPFSTTKSANFWSIGIIVALLIMNFHLLILNGWYDPSELRNRTLTNNKTEVYLYQNPDFHCYTYKSGFQVQPQWDEVNSYMSSWLPAGIMFLLNMMLIYKTFISGASSTANANQAFLKSQAKKRRITLSLLAITFAFVIQTLPAVVMWGFFYDPISAIGDTGLAILVLSDCFSFFSRTNVFLISYATNYKFRRAAISRLFSRHGTHDQQRRPTIASTANPRMSIALSRINNVIS